MLVELIDVQTSDGLKLTGSLSLPNFSENTAFRPTKSSRTAWLLIHGTGSNFYAGGVLQTFSRNLLEAGFPVLRVNTRGHDIITGQGQGAAFESIRDCCHDLPAWIDELAEHGFHDVVLVGHSMGAVKGLLFQSQVQHPLVTSVMAISPPRFCHCEWMTSDVAGPFREHFRQATELVAHGRGDELLRVQQPLPMWITASGFLDKYGPHDEYDIARMLPHLNCPTLVVLGSKSIESSPAFASTPALLAELQKTRGNLQWKLVPGADISYRGHDHQLIEIAQRWSSTM